MDDGYDDYGSVPLMGGRMMASSGRMAMGRGQMSGGGRRGGGSVSYGTRGGGSGSSARSPRGMGGYSRGGVASYDSQTGFCIHMRGLPFSASEQDILDVCNSMLRLY